jgi:hypothetical protein
MSRPGEQAERSKAIEEYGNVYNRRTAARDLQAATNHRDTRAADRCGSWDKAETPPKSGCGSAGNFVQVPWPS